ncbi:MAG: phosphatase PAP2 family protein [Prevotellaceae bacterium]|jgi:undecaprenyl-diphosphatase|nr:phosphatase PAP2 family protein [Prevotellaceae bacterium]
MIAASFPKWDTELFTYLNGLHCDLLDPVMKALSSIPLWIPMYLAVIGIIIVKRRFASLAVLCVLGLSFALSDQLAVHLFKNIFERLRPCHDETLKNMVYSLENCGGKYGFVSNHAANAFCFAMFSALFFRNRYWTIIIFLWATGVAYSRIYVGKHFPLDVVCGAIFGIICLQTALLLYNMLKIFVRRKWKNCELPQIFG